MRLLNLDLMKHPTNWLTVFLMVALGSFVFSAAVNYAFARSPSTDAN